MDIVESHFGFYHPELREMPWRIGVFSPEGWPESVDFPQGQSPEFALQLPAHREARHFAKEILSPIHTPILGGRRILRREGGNPKHGPRPLGIATRDERSV